MNQPLKVLVATPLGEGGKGGIDRIMDEVRRDLRETPRPDLSVVFAPTRGGGSLLLSPALLLSFVASMALLRATGQLDVLHINLSSHGSTVRKLLIGRAARLMRIPYVVHLHGSRFRQYWDGADAGLSQRIATLFSCATRTLVLGNVWKAYVEAKAPDARIEILPNATRAPSPLTPSRSEPPTILFLGRVGERKGVPELVEALGRLAANPGWRAVIAGDGDVAPMQEAARTAGVAERIQFTGWVGPDAVHDLLLSSDILVLPSHDENLPMSVIEGMGYGLAVVCTPVGAVEDIIVDGETGLLTPVGDPGALAAALDRLLENPGFRAELGSAARSFHAAHLEIKPYVARLIDIWAKVSAEAKPVRSA